MPSKNSYSTEITLDLSCEESVVIIKAKQFDNTIRTLDVTLFDSRDGRYWYDLDSTAEIRVQRPDGALVTAQCMRAQYNDEVTHYGVYLTDEMLEVSGRARADIRVIRGEEHKTISAGFVIEVLPSAHGSKPTGYISDTVNIKKITESEYTSITHNTNTLYIVTSEDGAVHQYLGDIEISGSGGGSAPQEAAIIIDSTVPDTIVGLIRVDEGEGDE